ncbi:MAG: hypothetical protein EOR60_30020 [Mesorhizobium sp.]|nr:MAG: hypothetical protein EOR60_30020 [Mesorhizobium sp.]
MRCKEFNRPSLEWMFGVAAVGAAAVVVSSVELSSVVLLWPGAEADLPCVAPLLPLPPALPPPFPLPPLPLPPPWLPPLPLPPPCPLSASAGAAARARMARDARSVLRNVIVLLRR